jgi:hypothetical protein
MSGKTGREPGKHNELVSALTVRLGMVAGGILGGFAGYWIRAATAPGQEGLWTAPTLAGAVAGFAASWAALAWLARRHRGAGILAGAALTIAAAAAVLAQVVSRRGG